MLFIRISIWLVKCSHFKVAIVSMANKGISDLPSLETSAACNYTITFTFVVGHSYLSLHVSNNN